jgi:hypothetical protein
MSGFSGVMALEDGGPTNAHKYILQLMASETRFPGKEKLELSAACITRSLGYNDRNHISIVCRELADADLLKKTEGKGTYDVITWRGRAYLEGELTLNGEE